MGWKSPSIIVGITVKESKINADVRPFSTSQMWCYLLKYSYGKELLEIRWDGLKYDA